MTNVTFYQNSDNECIGFGVSGHAGYADEGEDKMLKASKRENKNPFEIADFYTKAFLEDMKKLAPAVKELQKGIDLLAPEQTSASAAFNAHLISLNNQISALNSKSWFERIVDKYEPSTILYAGGAVGADAFSLNGRF